MLKIVTDVADRDDLRRMLDDLVSEGARRMLMAGLEAEVAAYVESCEELVDERGYRLVVRNGRAGERTLVTGAGALRVRAPRVNDRREGHRFSSYILPKYARRSPKVGDVLPVLYLRGLSTGDFAPALEGFFGSDAPGCRRRPSVACSRPGQTNMRRSRIGICRSRIMCMCGPTGSISVSAWRRTGCVVWL